MKVSVYCQEQQRNHSSSEAVILSVIEYLPGIDYLPGIGHAFIDWFLRVLFFIESSIYCYIDSSQCLAQLTPARIGIKARYVHVQLGASTHVIR